MAYKKAFKDITQAAAFLEVLATTSADRVAEQWNTTQKRGPTWKKKLLAGRKALIAARRRHPSQIYSATRAPLTRVVSLR